MDAVACDECRAIYRELIEAHRIVTGRKVDRIDPQKIEDWVLQLNAEDCASIRETSGLWKTWRRMQKHRSITGHMLSLLPLPPSAISNPN